MTTPLDVAARLARLALALDRRESIAAPILAAVAASGGTGAVLVGASAHGRRVDVVMPFSPAGLAALGGDPSTITANTAPSGLRARVDGDLVTAAVLSFAGASDAKGAVEELAPPAARAAWQDYVEQLCAIAGGKISGKTRWASGAAALEIRYPARDASGKPELYLLAAVAQLAAQLGVTEAQRTLWQRLHAGFDGAELALTTSITAAGGVSPVFGLAYPEPAWDHAVRVAQGTVLDAVAAADVPRRLGALAGALDSDVLQALELELSPHEPLDVIVWAKLAPA